MIKRKTYLRKQSPAKTPLAKLKKDLWKVLSELVRREEQACFTCGKTGSWKYDFQGGHYEHGKKFPVSYFDRRNVHCQCKRCNKWLKGNPRPYAIKLQEWYGQGILLELQQEKNIIKPPRTFFEERLHEYTQTLERLRRLDAGRQ